MGRPKGSKNVKATASVKSSSVKSSAKTGKVTKKKGVVYTVNVVALTPVTYRGQIQEISDNHITLLYKRPRESKVTSEAFNRSDIMFIDCEGSLSVGNTVDLALVPATRQVESFNASSYEFLGNGFVRIVLDGCGDVVEISEDFIDSISAKTDEHLDLKKGGKKSVAEEEEEEEAPKKKGKKPSKPSKSSKKEETEDDDDEDW